MAENDDFFEKILSHGPSAGSVFLILARMKAEGRLSEVVRGCIRFLTLYPNDVRLRVLLAESYAEMGFITMAGTEFEKAVAMIDDMASAYRSLADIYAKQRRYSEAADMMKRYLAHYPGQIEALEFLRRMEAVLLPEEALFEVEAPVEDFAPSEDESEGALVDFASPTIAELYYSQGQVDTAIQTYEKVLSSNPEDQESLRRLKELKGMAVESPPDAGEKAEVAFPGRKERMITILERWLPKITEIKYG